jgi:hypothetical protein
MVAESGGNSKAAKKGNPSGANGLQKKLTAKILFVILTLRSRRTAPA